MDLASLQQQLSQQQDKIPPVEKWDPPFCGDIDMQIRHDGSWFYMGTPIGREALVRLFASVIKQEDDQYFLVTPVEKVGIQVADVPFIITQWQQQADTLYFTTNTGDVVPLNADHPMVLQQDKTTGARLPYVKVRRNLWARLHQNVLYQLVPLGQETRTQDGLHLMLESAGKQFSLGALEP